MKKNIVLLLAALAIFLASTPSTVAAVFTGDLFYTNFAGEPNVNRVTYSYNDVTHSFTLGAPSPVASLNGADGIIFDAQGNLLVGGQGIPVVHQITTGGTFIADGLTARNSSFHLALDPTGTKVYTSPFGGPLVTLPLTPTIGAGTVTFITGSENGITQVAFNPNTGHVLYDNSQPNGGGTAGFINLATGATTRNVQPQDAIHGMIFDPFTNQITFFGRGKTGTLDAATDMVYKQSSMAFNSDFDQGAVDGQGHALVAGGNAITLLDYRTSGDITNPDFFVSIGGFSSIDDVAPLVGPGSNPIPEPATFIIWSLLGLAATVAAWRGKRSRGKTGQV